MGISIEDRHLVDRYLQGEVSGIELENFNHRMEADSGFRQEVELLRIIYSGIQKANHDKLKRVILSSLDYRKPRVPFALKMIVTFLVVTGIGITLWFYVGNERANKDQAKSWFAFLKSKKNVEEIKQEPAKQKTEYRQKSVPASDSLVQKEEENRIQQDSTVKDQTVLNEEMDSTTPSLREEDIIVRQDQLLVSATISVDDKSEEKEGDKEKTLTKDALQLLNPAADLPEEEHLTPKYIVEFWVSPINYRGYKMSKNKLILFGIDEPDAVKLYRVNNAVYMSYLKEFYRLNDSFDFVSFQKLRDSDIPLAIR